MNHKLDQSTSVYLNAVRFFAALIVFIGHISGKRFSGGLFWPISQLGDVAVMVFFVLRGASRYILPALVALMVGPDIMSVFPIWLLGFAVYHVSKRQLLPKWAAISIICATCSALAIFLLIVVYRTHSIERTTSLDYLYGAVFAANIVAVRHLSLPKFILDKIAAPVDWFAGITFSLYLFHLPVAQFISTIVP